MHMNQQDPHPVEAVKTIILREKERQERINKARAAAEKRLAHARTDALAALTSAEEAGAADGRREYEQALVEIEREAAELIEKAAAIARQITSRSEADRAKAVRTVVDFLLDPDGGSPS